MLLRFLFALFVAAIFTPEKSYGLATGHIESSLQTQTETSSDTYPIKPKKSKKYRPGKKPQYGGYDGYFYLGLLLIIANLILLGALIFMLSVGFMTLGAGFWIYTTIAVLGIACGIYIIIYFFT